VEKVTKALVQHEKFFIGFFQPFSTTRLQLAFHQGLLMMILAFTARFFLNFERGAMICDAIKALGHRLADPRRPSRLP
jgi:hypothetical protein